MSLNDAKMFLGLNNKKRKVDDVGNIYGNIKIITPVLLASAVIATQYLLSRTGKKRFGLIIPIITLAVIVYMHITGILGLKLIGTIL